MLNEVPDPVRDAAPAIQFNPGRRISTQYYGVVKVHESNTWAASISMARRLRRLGSFATEEEAARAYDAAARDAYGDNALLNFPDV